MNMLDSTAAARLAVVDRLRQQLEKPLPERDARPVWPSGWPTVDRQLLAGGVRPGMMVDWVASAPGSVAGLVGLLAASSVAQQRQGLLVVIDRSGHFYPPAAMAWGVDNRRLLIVRPTGDADHLWSIAQVLRSPAVAVVWATLGRIDSRAFRGLQLTAEEAGTPAMFIRPPSIRNQPTWSHAQLVVAPHPAPKNVLRQGCRWVSLSTTRLRGARATGQVVLRIDVRSGRAREYDE